MTPLVAVVMAALLASAPSSSATAPVNACAPAKTRALIGRFVTAFNAGDRRALDAAWASKLWFKWYSVTAEPGARTPREPARRDLLLPYFASRHGAHERLTLMNVKLNGISAGGYRNFEFDLVRSADDLPEGAQHYFGKGASTCSTGRLFVWVMGPAPGGQ